MLRLYTTADDSQAPGLMERLFEESIRPCCAESARRAMRSYGVRQLDRADQLEEVEAELLLQMTLRLRALRKEGDARIENLSAYILTAANNICLGRLRALSPMHTRVQNRVRYLLRNDKRFGAWTTAAGEQLGGLARWTGREDAATAPELQRSNEPLDRLVEISFDIARAPLRVSELSGTVAAASGAVAQTGLPASHDFDTPSNAPGADTAVMARQALERLWREVTLLPPPQRVATILNLRDGTGNGVIELLPASGVASFADIAEALDMTQEQLAAMWNDLPVDDLRIGAILNVSRQQVINLRKSARERLARRMKDGNTAPGSTSIRERIGSIWRRRQGPS